MWALFKKDVGDAIESLADIKPKKATCVTGVAAYPLIKWAVDNVCDKWHNLDVNVFAIENNFFGEKITVAGLVTGRDIIEQLSGKELGDELLIPSNMLRFERDLFLDDTSVSDVEKALSVKVKICEPDGYSFVECLVGD